MKSDEEIDTLVRHSQTPVELRPNFSAEVWRRVAQAEAATPSARWSRIVERFLAGFFRPAALAGSFALAIGCGLWLGWRPLDDAEHGRLAYVQSISPFVPKVHKAP